MPSHKRFGSSPDLPPLSEYELVHKVPTIRLAGEEESEVIGEKIELVIRTRVTQITKEQNLLTHVRDLLERKLITKIFSKANQTPSPHCL